MPQDTGKPRSCCGPVGGFPPDIEDAHRCAVEQGEDMYTDPKTGYMVFTEEAQRKRGNCCGRGCRHCPFGHWNVALSEHRKNIVQRPTLLPPKVTTNNGSTAVPLEVVFWSGGKDSFLALLARQQVWKQEQVKRQCCLVTTFDPASGMVPEQNISVSAVMDQARALGERLLIVPLPESCDGDAYVSTVGDAMTREILPSFGVADLSEVTFVFGDLHLADIRQWREENLGRLGPKCLFPLFGESYLNLVESLSSNPHKASVKISAVSGKGVGVVEVGQTFDKQLVDDLRRSGKIDAFGENGEFHTEVSFAKILRSK